MAASFSDFISLSQKNKIETLALFSKAVYAIQDWENEYINDPSPGADEAYTSLLAKGWQTVDFDVTERTNTFKSSSAKFTSVTKMEDGFYTHANAAALVARSGDALVLSFRGTNDSNKKGGDSLDPSDNYHPDEDHWTPGDLGSNDSMTNHYDFYSELFQNLNQYLSENPSIQKVYVTGHSMGGAMAIEYMSNHVNANIADSFESVVFAAAPFTYKRNFLGVVHREDYSDDERILQLEISGDPVADSWDYGLDNNRPGQVIKLHGNKTMDKPDSKYGETFRSDNHSMNYYLEMASGIDSESWRYIVANSSLNNVSDVLLGGEQKGSNYIVASQKDNLTGSSHEFIYGGEAADSLSGGSGQNFLLGGDGDDTLMGGGGNDVLLGGSDVDVAKYQGIAANFTFDLSKAGDKIVTSVQDRTDLEGTDLLNEIEIVDFSSSKDINLDIIDGVVNLNSAELRSLVEVYIASFSRAPDAEGLYYWGDRFNDGMSLQQIAQSFFDQAETQSIYGRKTNSELVSTVYQNFLGRDAEKAGRDYWVDELDNNIISKDSFLLAVINGAQSEDRAYINSKADLGVYFSAILGMNNVEAAYDVMSEFTGTVASLDAAKSSIDEYHASAIAADNGELLIRVVGVIDDPFIV